MFAHETSQRLGSLRGGAGNEQWLAPELLVPSLFGTEPSRPTFASDLYSYGCVVVEVRIFRYQAHTIRSPSISFSLISLLSMHYSDACLWL